MKYALLLISIFAITSLSVQAQSTFEILKDPFHNNSKILKGLITKSDIANEPEFADWYAESQRAYPNPDTAAVNALRRNKDKIYLIIFGGTWCSDTHYILPKFFKIQEASGFPEDRITLYASDRNKHTNGSIAEAFNALNVPTIIVMKGGKELGRVVEYGTTGRWDKELADIIQGVPKR